MIKVMVKNNSAVLLLFKLYNFRLPRVLNNPRDSTGMLSDDGGASPVANKLKKLQLPSLLLCKTRG